MITSEQVVSRVRALPPLPTSVVRLLALVRDDRSSAHDFEQVVRVDPALTANVLRVANSVLFRGASPTTTVGQAVVRLGTNRVLQVAAASALQRVVPRELPGYRMPAAAFWLHSIAVAVLSERLARRARLPAERSAFTAGLLHDVGKLVIGEFLAGLGDAVLGLLRSEPLAFLAAERRLLGTDHCEVAEQLAARWHLPDEVAAVARWHHLPEEAPAHPGLVSVVHVANSLAHSFGLGTDIGGLHRHLSRQAVEQLDLKPADLEHLVGECFDELVLSADVLGLGEQGA